MGRTRARHAGVLAALFGALLSALIAHPTAQAQQPAPQGLNNVDIVLILDESASMWTKNDPPIGDGATQKNLGWRIAAINQLAGALATDQSSTHYQFGLILFGGTSKVVFPLQPIDTPQAQAALQQAIKDNHKDMGSTNILPTLQLAKEELDKSSVQNAKKQVIYLSDGVCEPVPLTTIPQRRACEDGVRQVLQRDFLKAGGIAISTVALTFDAWAPDPLLAGANLKNLWQEIALKTGGDYYEAAQAEGDLVAIFAKIQRRLFGLPDQPAPVTAVSPGEQPFALPANLTQAIFTTVKNDPAISSVIIRPDGTTVKSADAGVKQVAGGLAQSTSILHPAAGTWRIKSNGAGKVTTIDIRDTRIIQIPDVQDVQPVFSLDVASPARLHPQNKPLEIRARVLNANRVAQTVPDFKVVVTLPNGAQATPALTASGSYYTALLPDTSKTGVYTLAFSAKPGGMALAEQRTVNVQPIPWLKLSAPQSGVDYKGVVPVQAQVLLGAALMGALQPGEQLQVVAHLINVNGQEVDINALRTTGSNGYSTTLLTNDPGSYTARLTLAYVTAGGDKYEDSAEVAVSVLPGAPAAQAGAIGTAAPPSPTSTIAPAAPTVAVPAEATPTQFSLFGNDLTPIYIAITFLGVIMLLTLIVTIFQVNALNGIRKVFNKSVELQDMIVKAWHVREVNAQLTAEAGWKPVVDQLVADAMQESMSIDSSAGILDLTTEPSPKFTLLTRDGRQVVFTTDPWAMKKMHLIQRGDKVIDISALSRVTHLDAGLLWMCMQDKRNLPHVAIPANAHWFIVMRASDARGYSTNTGLLRPGSVPFLEQLPAPPATGDRA